MLPTLVLVLPWWSPLSAAAPPVARAGQPFLAYPGDTIELNGSSSADPDGQEIETWAWAQVGGPEVALSGTGGASPSFTVDQPGVHSFSLTVAAGGQTSAADVVDVIVVDPDAGTRYAPGAGGCAVAPSSGGAVGAGLALLGLARRRRS